MLLLSFLSACFVEILGITPLLVWRGALDVGFEILINEEGGEKAMVEVTLLSRTKLQRFEHLDLENLC